MIIFRVYFLLLYWIDSVKTFFLCFKISLAAWLLKVTWPILYAKQKLGVLSLIEKFSKNEKSSDF